MDYAGFIRFSESKQIISVDEADSLRAAIERARVVGVLDAWAAKERGREWSIQYCHGQTDCYHVVTQPRSVSSKVRGYGTTADAARAAAAKAIEAGEV